MKLCGHWLMAAHRHDYRSSSSQNFAVLEGEALSGRGVNVLCSLYLHPSLYHMCCASYLHMEPSAICRAGRGKSAFGEHTPNFSLLLHLLTGVILLSDFHIGVCEAFFPLIHQHRFLRPRVPNQNLSAIVGFWFQVIEGHQLPEQTALLISSLHSS